MSKPGWYQDHSGSQPVWRYWDGTEWTDSTAPIQEAPAAPRAPQATVTEGVRSTSSLELFGRRLGGYFVDGLLVSAVLFPVMWILERVWQPTGSLPATAVGEFLTMLSTLLLVVSAVGAVGVFLFQVLTIPRLGATPGMKLFSLHITPANGSNLGAVGFRRGCFFAILSGIPFFGAWMSLSATGTDNSQLLSSYFGILLTWALLPAIIMLLLFIFSSCAVLWSSDHTAWHDHWTSARVQVEFNAAYQPVKPSKPFTITVCAIALVGLMFTFIPTPIDDKVEPFINELVKDGTLPAETSAGL